VLIVRVEGDDAIVSRLRAELRHEDWHVVELPARSADARRSLDSLAREHAASAGLRARPSQLAVELWVAAAGDHNKAGSEEVLAGPRADLGVLALRVTEVLRARGLVPPRPDDRGAGAPAAASDGEASAKPGATGSRAEGESSPKSGAAASAPAASAAASSGAPASGATAGGPTPSGATASAAGSGAAVSSAAANAAAGQALAAQRPAASTPAEKPASQAGTLDAHTAAPPSTPPSAAAQPEPSEPTTAQEEPSEPEAESGEEIPAEPPFPALIYVELAPALVLSPGGLGPSFDAFGNVRVQPLEAVSFSLFVLAPLLHSTVSSDYGSTDVRTLGVGGSADLQLPFSAWEFSAGLGAAALVTWLHGYGTRYGYMAHDETKRTAAVLARVGLSWGLTSTLRLSGRVLVGFAIPELQIEFPDKTVHWGEPFVMGALGLELALPWQR
jgi:hypothetical protein